MQGSSVEASARGQELIRYRYNTIPMVRPDGDWKWRVIFERHGQFEEQLVKELFVNVPSFSHTDEGPVFGRMYHMACRGVFRLEDGIGIIDADGDGVANEASGGLAGVGDL